MTNLKKRIAKLEQDHGSQTITLYFADGRTEVITGSKEYMANLFCLLVRDEYGDPPQTANALQAKHVKWFCECEVIKEAGGATLFELGLALRRTPRLPEESDPTDIPIPAPSA